MAYKVSIFWVQQADKLGGWSENFWNNGSNFDSVQSNALALMNALDDVHGLNTLPVNIRFSVIDSPRDANQLTISVTVNAPSSTARASDIQNTAALMRLSGAPNYTTNQWIRSCHDGDVNSGGRWLPLASTTTALNKVFGLLRNAGNGWCIRVQDRSVPKLLISGATSSGVITVNAHPYVSGQKVQITRARGTMGINGKWEIVKIDSNNFSLVGYQTPAGTPVYLGNGKVYAISKILVPINDGRIVRATSVRTGRPFGQLIGRRRKKGRVSAG